MKHTSITDIKAVLQKNGFSPLKQFGQNFLVDENTVINIAKVAGIDGKNVIEVGPGLGALTDQLMKTAKKLVAVEIDNGFFGYLQEAFGANKNVTFINEDILKTDIAALCSNQFDQSEIVLAANLPYYITSAVIMQFLEADIPLARIVVMVQREVGERFCAKPGTKAYGALTAIVQYFGIPKVEMKVSPGCFYPTPDVESAIISINVEKKADDMSRKYIKFVKSCFAMKRKTLVNNLVKAGYEKNAILDALAQQNIDVMARAETLSTKILIELTNSLTRL